MVVGSEAGGVGSVEGKATASSLLWRILEEIGPCGGLG